MYICTYVYINMNIPPSRYSLVIACSFTLVRAKADSSPTCFSHAHTSLTLVHRLNPQKDFTKTRAESEMVIRATPSHSWEFSSNYS